MIEITVVETGDTAYAEDAEAALLAARTIGEEARQTIAIWANDPTVTFTVEGVEVRRLKLSQVKRDTLSELVARQERGKA